LLEFKAKALINVTVVVRRVEDRATGNSSDCFLEYYYTFAASFVPLLEPTRPRVGKPARAFPPPPPPASFPLSFPLPLRGVAVKPRFSVVTVLRLRLFPRSVLSTGIEPSSTSMASSIPPSCACPSPSPLSAIGAEVFCTSCEA